MYVCMFVDACMLVCRCWSSTPVHQGACIDRGVLVVTGHVEGAAAAVRGGRSLVARALRLGDAVDLQAADVDAADVAAVSGADRTVSCAHTGGSIQA